MMTVAEIKQTLKDIKKISDDDETAHSMEDSLYINVLKTIAEGKMPEGEAVKLAREALKARAIAFSRWFA